MNLRLSLYIKKMGEKYLWLRIVLRMKNTAYRELNKIMYAKAL